MLLLSLVTKILWGLKRFPPPAKDTSLPKFLSAHDRVQAAKEEVQHCFRSSLVGQIEHIPIVFQTQITRNYVDNVQIKHASLAH